MNGQGEKPRPSGRGAVTSPALEAYMSGIIDRNEYIRRRYAEETGAMTKIKCGDHIHHEPSGEDWVVAYVNGDHLVCQGWPESAAKLSDCVLIKSCSFEEHIASLEECAKSSGSRAYHARKRLDELAKETWPEEIWLQPDTIFYPDDDEDGYAGCSVAFGSDHGGFKYIRSDLVASLKEPEQSDADR